MGHSPSETSSHWASQAITRLLWESKVRYRVHKARFKNIHSSKQQQAASDVSSTLQNQFTVAFLHLWKSS